MTTSMITRCRCEDCGGRWGCPNCDGNPALAATALLAALRALVQHDYARLHEDGLTRAAAPPVLIDALTAIEKAERH